MPLSSHDYIYHFYHDRLGTNRRKVEKRDQCVYCREWRGCMIGDASGLMPLRGGGGTGGRRGGGGGGETRAVGGSDSFVLWYGGGDSLSGAAVVTVKRMM